MKVGSTFRSTLIVLGITVVIGCKSEQGSTLNESGFAANALGCVGTEDEIGRIDRDLDTAQKDFAKCTEAAPQQQPSNQGTQSSTDSSNTSDPFAGNPFETSPQAEPDPIQDGTLQLQSGGAAEPQAPTDASTPADPQSPTDQNQVDVSKLSAECQNTKRYIDDKKTRKEALRTHLSSGACKDVMTTAVPRHYSICPATDICKPSQGAECYRCVWPTVEAPVVGVTCASTQGAKEAINIWCDTHEDCGDRSLQPTCSTVSSGGATGNTEGLAKKAADQAGAKDVSEVADKKSVTLTKTFTTQVDLSMKVEVGKFIVSSVDYKKTFKFDTIATAKFYTEDTSDIYVERDGRVEFTPNVKFVCTSGKTQSQSSTVSLNSKTEIPLVIAKVSGSETLSFIDTATAAGSLDSPPLNVGGKTAGEMIDQCGEIHKKRAMDKLLDPNYVQMVARLETPNSPDAKQPSSNYYYLNMANWTKDSNGPLVKSIKRIYTKDGIVFRATTAYGEHTWTDGTKYEMNALVPWKDVLEADKDTYDKYMGITSPDAAQLALLVMCKYPTKEFGLLLNVPIFTFSSRSIFAERCPK